MGTDRHLLEDRIRKTAEEASYEDARIARSYALMLDERYKQGYIFTR